MYRFHAKKLNIVMFAGLFFVQCTLVSAQDDFLVASVEKPFLAIPDRPLNNELKQVDFSQKLAGYGFGYEAGYTAEYFGKIRGGSNARNGGEYLGSIDASVNFDLGKARLGRGLFFVGAQNLHGRGVNDSWVGAIQNPSNIDDAEFTRLIEIWYSDEYFQGKLKTRIGRQYADSEFGVIENGSEFINSSYGAMPNNPIPTFPLPSLGASVWITPLSWMSIGAGIFRGKEMDGPDFELPS